MKKPHRTIHRLAWLLLLPALLGFVYLAQHAVPAEPAAIEAAPYPSAAGELP